MGFSPWPVSLHYVRRNHNQALSCHPLNWPRVLEALFKFLRGTVFCVKPRKSEPEICKLQAGDGADLDTTPPPPPNHVIKPLRPSSAVTLEERDHTMLMGNFCSIHTTEKVFTINVNQYA